MDKFLDDVGLSHLWGKFKKLLAAKADSGHTHTLESLGAAKTDYGMLGVPDILAWAEAQSLSGSFAVMKNSTTTNLPVANTYYIGFLDVTGASAARRIMLTNRVTGDTFVNATYNSAWIGWKQVSASDKQTVAWGDVTGKPSTFPPATHDHEGDDLAPRTLSVVADALIGGDIQVYGSATLRGESVFQSLTRFDGGLTSEAPITLYPGAFSEPDVPNMSMVKDTILQMGPQSILVTLAADAWSTNTQTITVSGVLADESKQLIMPMPAMASQANYAAAGIACTAQGENTLTFQCQTVPTSDIQVYVVTQEMTPGSPDPVTARSVVS